MVDFFTNKRIVVTGGSGFIGSHFIDELLKRGCTIKTHTHVKKIQPRENLNIVENIDLTKLEDAIKLVEGADYVIHCAGEVAHPSTVPTDIQISLKQLNLIGNVLEACAKTKVKKFLDLNSSTGYPDIRRPVTEDEFWIDEPYTSYFGYGWMRRYREKLMEHVSKFSGLEVLIARCTATFGPRDNFDLRTCHVVPALIKRHLNNEDPFVVWGSPDVVRDFLYVKDVVNGALLILEKGKSLRPYNLGYGNGISIGEIVKSIIKTSGKNPEVRWDNSKPTTIPFRAVNVERIKNELGFTPKYTFEMGIKETIEWYLTNIDEK